jgi:hypothetical protein
MVAKTPAGATHAYDVGIRTLSSQFGRIDALDTKAGVIVAADGVTAGFLLSQNSTLRAAPAWLAIILILAIFGSIGTALIAFATRRYQNAPKLDSVIRLMTADTDWLKWRFLGNIQAAARENQRKIERKATFVTTAIVQLLVAVSLLGAYSMWRVVRP